MYLIFLLVHMLFLNGAFLVPDSCVVFFLSRAVSFSDSRLFLLIHAALFSDSRRVLGGFALAQLAVT